jgi:hypothetical protein
MFPQLAADAVLLLHLGFVVFGVLGAVLAIRWRWVPLLQLPAATWGFFVEITGRVCPLTTLENHLRALAGQAGYEGGFIQHYLLAVLYPAGLTRGVQFALAAIVVATNLAIYTWLLRRRRRTDV